MPTTVLVIVARHHRGVVPPGSGMPRGSRRAQRRVSSAVADRRSPDP
ncbi:hypothetical protein [Nocardia sp. NPDC024068]